MPTFDRDDTFLARWLSGELSEEERTAFEQSEDYAAFKAIAETSTDLTTPNYDKDTGWAALDKLTPAKTPAKVRRLIPWRAIAASVAIVLLAGAGWLWSGQKSQSTQAGEQLFVELPDGSTSLLNGQSTLAYNARLWSWRRRVNLTG
ncbi:MAG: histidine kinase, partial [Bacteroidota bacterium]